MRSRLHAVAAVAAVLAAAACSSSVANPGSADPDDAGASPDGSAIADGSAAVDGGPDAASTGEVRLEHARRIQEGLMPIARAFCRSRFRCCTDDELALDFGPYAVDEETCSLRLFEWAVAGAGRGGSNAAPLPPILQYFVPIGYAVDPARVSVDDGAAAACAASVDDAACASPVPGPCDPPPEPADPCALRTVYIGRQLAGDSCGSGWDGSSVDCAPGLVCHVLAPAHGVCLPEGARGGPCFSDLDCGPLRCDARAGECVEGLAPGKACAFRNPVNPLPGTEVVPCLAGLVCDPTALKCVSPECQTEPGTDPPAVDAGGQASLKPRGAPCNSSSECSGTCGVAYGEPRCLTSLDGTTCTGR